MKTQFTEAWQEIGVSQIKLDRLLQDYVRKTTHKVVVRTSRERSKAQSVAEEVESSE